jgi:hypothetical protein
VHRAAVAVVIAAQLAGCFTYAINVSDPKGETTLILAGVDVAAGLSGGIVGTIVQGKIGNLMENIGLGILSALVVDLAVGLTLAPTAYVGD